MNSEQKRAFLAVTLSGLILFGWQYFFAPKQPIVTETPVNKEVEVANTITKSNEISEQLVAETKSDTTNLTNYTLSDGKTSITINNYMQITNMKGAQSESKFEDVVGPNKFDVLFTSMSGGKKVFFNVQEEANELIFTNTEEGLDATISLLKDRVHFKLTSANQRKITFNFQTEEKEKHGGHVRNYVALGEGLETMAIGNSKNGDESIQWFGIDYDYHLFAIAFPKKTASVYRSTEDNKFNLIPNADVNGLEFDVLFVKKEYDFLKGLGSGLHLAIDFGIFSILAVPILRGLQFIYDFIPNYGLAIILLTILLRLITFPLQWKSYKSMKKMQDIQPELAKLKERFKDDPPRMQKESMELFKRAGANPLGGCLPLLLQMPFFFAFYKVLYGAVELVHAPFLLWIHDLSVKDPFYILPVLMAGAMFLQQKLSPTTVTDPAQKKVMMFMPLIFALIMKDFPAGLCLYIFVSTIFGVLQQMFVYKQTT